MVNSENINELLRLVRENPDLPIVPMVDGECVTDDCGYFAASFGKVLIDEYLICKRNDRIVFKSEDDVFDTLDQYLSYEEYSKLPETEEECRPYYDALPWTKAIIVCIEPFSH